MATKPTKTKATAKADAPPVAQDVATLPPPQIEKPKTPGQRFEAELQRMAPAIRKALPETVTWSQFERAAIMAVQRDPKLITDYDIADVLIAVQEAASDGLMPDGYEGAIVPRWDDRKGRTIPRWEAMYQGLLKLARNTGEITKITANIVYAGEPFRVILGEVDKIEHERVLELVDPTLKTMVGAYAIAWLKNGMTVSRHMTAQRLNVIRAMSPARKGPWSGVFVDEMVIKTMFRSLVKWLPFDNQNREHARFLAAIARDNFDLDAIVEEPKPDALAKIEAQAKPKRGKAGAQEQAPAPTGQDAEEVSKAAARKGLAAAQDFAKEYIADMGTKTRHQIEEMERNKAVASRLFRLAEAYPDIAQEINAARTRRLAELARNQQETTSNE